MGVPVMIAPDLRPSWRGWIHAAAFAFAVPGLLVLLVRAEGPLAIAAVTVYGLGLVIALGTSACYHRLRCAQRTRLILRRMDHSTIFMLIAGSYTPVCLIALPPTWGIPLLCVVGAGSLLGIALKQFAFARFPMLQQALYPLLGWAAVVTMPALVRSLDAAELGLLVAGGLMYTFGIPVLFLRRPNPWPSTFGYHEIWHVATVLGAACHFALVVLLLR